MDRKGIELAISTLIVLVIAILVLIAIVFAFQGGFKNLQSATDPLTESAGISAFIQACDLACSSGNALTYCCEHFTLGDEEEIHCSDGRLGLDCNIDCFNVQCDTEDDHNG